MKDKDDNNMDDKSTHPSKETKDEQTEEQKRVLMEKLHKFTKRLKTMPGVIDAYVEEK